MQELLPSKSRQYNFPPQRSSARSPPQQPCSVSRVTIDIGTEGLKRSNKDKRREIPLFLHVCEEEKIEGKMGPEWRMLESSPAGTGVEVPEQRRLSLREI